MMYSIEANSNARLCYKILVQIHATAEAIVNIGKPLNLLHLKYKGILNYILIVDINLVS